MAKNGSKTVSQATDDAETSVPAISFEQAMEKLESIVAKLESGDVPLETAIELFQEGMSLSKLCGNKLEQVERRIEMLVEGDAGLQRKPFADQA
ncbi:exodeoxyribonuclease VII small subunit [Cohnella endophytica]|uniref:Exodeoxyribonuclease 7 small subunit n=1 Tax=Cohnella endophytica TaxID=2419778 RepID=A0A494YB57_9BACL|nr:exodeoxyribonuclease VII small subunit [Cohnella endophytica]RKP57162.1 exodeoxyribonuclease VII small subunit [Cohnella endophytica]